MSGSTRSLPLSVGAQGHVVAVVTSSLLIHRHEDDIPEHPSAHAA